MMLVHFYFSSVNDDASAIILSHAQHLMKSIDRNEWSSTFPDETWVIQGDY